MLIAEQAKGFNVGMAYGLLHAERFSFITRAMAKFTQEHARILSELGPSKVIELLEPFFTERRTARLRRILDSRIPGLTVVIERVYDPRNAAAVIRTAEALGLTDVYLVDVQGKDVSRKVTIGSETWINVHQREGAIELMEELRERSIQQIAGIPPEPDTHSGLRQIPDYPDSIPHRKLVPQWPVAVWMGNEREGLSAAVVQGADVAFHIPMYGLTQSLNLSVSTALILEHLGYLYRQQGQPGLPEDEKENLLARFMLVDQRDSLTLIRRLLRSSDS